MSSTKTIGIFAWHINDISGTGVVLRNLLHFLENTLKIKFLVILPASPILMSEQQLEKFSIKLVEKKNLSHQAWIEAAEKTLINKIDLAFYLNNIVPRGFKIPFVVLLHDVLPLTLPEYRNNPWKLWQEKKRLSLAKKAKFITTVSDFSKNEICRLLKVPSEKILRIYNGVDINFEKMPLLDRPEKRQNILYVGDLRKRKNVLSLAKAYLMLPKEIQMRHPLHLTGEGREKKKILSLFEKANLQQQIEFLGKIDLKKVVEFYDRAFIFVFPSLMEGFGLPVIEAARRKVPIICGNNSSLIEIAKDNALLCNTACAKEITNAILLLYQNKELRKTLIKKGFKNSFRFSFAKAALTYQTLFEKLLF